MFNDPFFIVVLIAVLIVAVILLAGIGTFTKGGEFNKRNANKIMRMRIVAQFIAICFILAFVWFRGRGGG